MKSGYVYLMALFIVIGCREQRELKHYKFVATDTDVTPKEKQTIAGKVGLLFPSEIKYLPGKVTVKTDTLLQESFEIIRDTINGIDTVIKYKTIVREITRVDTFSAPDPATSAALFDCYQNRTWLETKNKALQTLNDETEARVTKAKNNNKTLIWWLVGVSVAFAFSLYMHVKRVI